MIPFDSWDGKNDLTGTIEQNKLEKWLGPHSVVFGTYQSAISSILEVLGTRTHLIPVVLPITASPDTIAGVLRAGGDPLLLDIHPQTLQINPEDLRSVLSEIQAAVVVLTRPAGQLVDPELIKIVGDNPTILDTRLVPRGPIADTGYLGTFNVFDLGPVIGTGAVVLHKFAEQVRELKMVRNGVLGLSSNLNDVLSAYALKRFKSDALAQRFSAQKTVSERYMSLFPKSFIHFSDSPDWPYFIVRVSNADKVIANLHHIVGAVKPIFPLHLLSEVNKRWVEKPHYPVAEDLCRKLIALPTHVGILGNESMIVSNVLDVSCNTDFDDFDPVELSRLVEAAALPPGRLTRAAELVGRKCEPDEARRILLPLLRSPEALVREGAVRGLMLAGRDVAVVAELSRLATGDSSPGVRAAASDALENLDVTWRSV